LVRGKQATTEAKAKAYLCRMTKTDSEGNCNGNWEGRCNREGLWV
jgi:hypothetical protein